MNFKRTIDSLLGQTSSSNVTIIEKSHFNGRYFRKVIDIENSAEIKAKDVKDLDRRYPKDAPHKPAGWDYRFHFKLDLNSRPSGFKIIDLISYSGANRNYKAFVKLLQPSGLRNLNNEPEFFTQYIGFKLCDWLEIETGYSEDGELLDYMGKDGINAFAVSYKHVYELHDGDKISEEMDMIVIHESEVNQFIQQVLKQEIEIFLKECLKMTSPH